MTPITLSITDAANALGIGRSSTYVLINIGNLKTIKIGRRRLVTVDSLRALVGRQLGGA
jgi:excisionase family DNA binding protein